MKKFSLLIVMAVLAVCAHSQSEAPQFDKIAIIPFHLLGYPDADDIETVQTNIEEAFDQLQIPATVMSAAETSAVLSKKGINKGNIHSNTIEDLASALGVDALIIGEVNSASNGDESMNEIKLQLIDGTNGEMIWSAAKDIALTESGVNVNSVMSASTAAFPVGNN